MRVTRQVMKSRNFRWQLSWCIVTNAPVQGLWQFLRQGMFVHLLTLGLQNSDELNCLNCLPWAMDRSVPRSFNLVSWVGFPVAGVS
jgi:hypothetical protein